MLITCFEFFLASNLTIFGFGGRLLSDKSGFEAVFPGLFIILGEAFQDFYTYFSNGLFSYRYQEKRNM